MYKPLKVQLKRSLGCLCKYELPDLYKQQEDVLGNYARPLALQSRYDYKPKESVMASYTLELKNIQSPTQR